MNKRMLIDTTHAEETRVVVMDGDRLEDYDIETSSKKQIKGNIYLAKVIRVEPSLQAAFVDYGGNRHGFLAFSEIHPDYFQIPVADREKLLALQDEDLRADERAESEQEVQASTEADSAETVETEEFEARPETVGGEHDTGDEGAAARRTARFLRNYKIQEVIRRRQILLVQVVKEERGNKGAALTTYVSLAGRYCVLMPNALRGGGVSRKITSDSDRKRLRDIIAELDLPRGMAMIVRTAGAQRPGPEITRDCEYLLQLWDDIRNHTLSSVAPTLIYEEANLIKRAIRDLFSKDIEEIIIDGEPAWKNAREFMRLLMPHNANKVKLWRDQSQSLFGRYHVEGHLDAIFSPTAQLKSGGYLVINQTEALVSIDVNSGRSTGQRNIEDTAVRTNLEAAEEVARQLRLRDLAGLVVIDFIDMESRKHNAMVEKRLKDALRSDRARIQIGQISHFGLLEMSRQRLRPSISEAVLVPCPHCQGTGHVRGVESAALHVLRAVDEEGLKQKAAEISVHITSGIALYIFNNKRDWLAEIEQRHRMRVSFQPDDSLTPADLRIERLRPQVPAEPRAVQERAMPERAGHDAGVQVEPATFIEHEEEPEQELDAAQSGEARDENGREEGGREEGGRRRRRRRRRNGRRSDEFREGQGRDDQQRDATAGIEEEAEVEENAPEQAPTEESSLSEAEALIVPGRRRMRTRRVSREERAEPAREARPTEERRNAPERKETRWEGPTPANPFGGASFDIFDMIEQAESRLGAPSALNTEPKPTLAESIPAEAPQPPAEPKAETSRHGIEAEGRKSRSRPRRRPVAAEVNEPAPSAPVAEDALPVPEPVAVAEADQEKPAPRRRGRPRKTPVAAEIAEGSGETAAAQVETSVVVSEPEAPKPRRARAPRKAAKDDAAPVETEKKAPAKGRASRAKAKVEETAPVVQPINVDEVAPARPRTGWWKR
ncbi:ribonuclease E/G [Asaia krungthepensis]|uniref:Ribonuclease E n=1 Tax=Asaia krungthepensis NRIC 0535 TaxID=1307925 RepID=A0ABQ0PYN3_9PROT|nr:ribonuclease E/G [Asaia krungthepensis]GBQ84870.1 ribonuclease E [Asaia krungthepensis NRIC 0535]